jgi:hypothetical protein
VVLPDGTHVSGTVEAEGELPELTVSAAGKGIAKRWDRVREDGSFDVGPFPPGRVDLVITGEEGVWHEVEGVETGTEGLRVRVIVPRGFDDLRGRIPRRLSPRAWALLWTRATARGVTEEADLVALLPELAAMLRAEGESALAAFHVLARIATRPAVRALTRLLLDDGISRADDAPSIAPAMMDLEGPGLAAAAVAMFRRSVAAGETSWVHMDPICALLARHGGDQAVTILTAALLGTEPSVQAGSAAAKALGRASDPRLLAAGLRAIDHGASPGRARSIADELVEGFGEQALAAFRRRLDDPETPHERRMLALATLARHGTAAEVDRLLGREVEAEGGGWWCVLARELPRRRDGLLVGRRLVALTEAVKELLVHADPSVRQSALGSIGYGEVFHTPAVAATLESLRETDLHPRSVLERTLAGIRETLAGE